MKNFWKNNALSIVMFVLFLGFWAGQSVTGWLHARADKERHGQAASSYTEYIGTGHFFEATFENWESEFFQMAAFIYLSAFLIQRGAAESRKPDGEDEDDGDPREHMTPDSPGPVHRGGLALKLYSHSLGLALAGLFVASFVAHALSGAAAYNEDGAEHGAPPVSWWQFMGTSTFWFESFQNWQSEFLSVGALIVLSIFLRQKGSPESKPVHAPHAQTGAS